MAGHSKWANIKFRKAAQDAKRGKIFTKLIREITIATRSGGEDVANNPRLRDAIDKALKANVKRDTVNNAIKRGTGEDKNDNMFECTYEGYGPGGVAVLVDCISDNKNRTVSEVRFAFTKYGGNLGTSNSVAFQFTKRGEIYFEDKSQEERIFELALELGATDVESDEEGILVVTSAEQFSEIQQALKKAGLEPEDAELAMYSENKITVEGETAEKLLKMIAVLEDLDDVQNVYTNADMSAETLEAYHS